MKRACAVILMALAASAQSTPEPVTVSAAISLTEALEAAARAYASAGGGPVRFNFAGSNVLARQIVSGARVDVFVSADGVQMDLAERAGAIDATSRVDLLGNRLAIVTRRDGPRVDAARALLQPAIRRVAIGDPAAVPAGVYARAFLEASGLWTPLQPKLVPVSNVRAAIAAVENGSADAAIAYETDAATAKVATMAFVLDGKEAPRIVYPAAIVTASRNRAAAERFLAFLRSPEAGTVFKLYKFTPLGAGR
jgi:molybdate transport system substrate-binding protein